MREENFMTVDTLNSCWVKLLAFGGVGGWRGWSGVGGEGEVKGGGEVWVDD